MDTRVVSVDWGANLSLLELLENVLLLCFVVFVLRILFKITESLSSFIFIFLAWSVAVADGDEDEDEDEDDKDDIDDTDDIDDIYDTDYIAADGDPTVDSTPCVDEELPISHATVKLKNQISKYTQVHTGGCYKYIIYNAMGMRYLSRMP